MRCLRRLTAAMATFATVGHTQSPTAKLPEPLPGEPLGVTAFMDVQVVPMNKEQVLRHQTVLVEGGRITTLGAANRVKVPIGARRIDGRGKFLIPGLSDCHVHIGYNPFQGNPTYRLLLWLANGVTTVRNMDYVEDQRKQWGLNGTDALGLRASAAAGEILSPQIYTAGQWAPRQYTNVPATSEMPSPNLDSIPAYVAAYKAAGYDFLKIHEETAAVFSAVLAAAREVGMPVVGHIPRSSSPELALEGGMRSIEHLWGLGYSSWPYDESMSDNQIQARVAAIRHAGVWNCVTGNGHTKLITALQRAGAGLLVGSDFPLWSGVDLSLEFLVRDAGLTPYEALATGTKNFALFMKTLDETGMIAVGERADLVLLEGNPLQDIANVKRRAGVMRGGRWFTRDELEQRLLPFLRYWLVTELNRANRPLAWETQQPQVMERITKFEGLNDSLVTAKPSEHERVAQLLAAELGAIRTILTPEQHATFDPIAQVWRRMQAQQGHRVAIPGVPPAP